MRNRLDALPHGLKYVLELAAIVLLIPLHELLHAGTCIGFGGAVMQLNLFSHTVCGGTINAMGVYDVLNTANEAVTLLFFTVRLGTVHHTYLFSPAVDFLRAP